MWLAHELDVLTAICTPIKIGGKKKRECTAGTKTGMQEPQNCTVCILGSKTKKDTSKLFLKKVLLMLQSKEVSSGKCLFSPFLIIVVGV